MNLKSFKIKKIMISLLLCILIISFLLNPTLIKAESIISITNPESTTNSVVNDITDNAGYSSYLAKHADKINASCDVSIPLMSYNKELSKEIEESDGIGDSKTTAILTTENSNVLWEFSVDQEGFYNIEINYYPMKGNSGVIKRTMKVDGEVPFNQAKLLEFERIWCDSKDKQIDTQGNDIRSEQIENPSWVSKKIEDNSGYNQEPLKIYFSKGMHSLEIISDQDTMAIGAVYLRKIKNVSDYKDVYEQWKIQGLKDATTEIIVQAENSTAKSDQTMLSLNDRTSPSTIPYDSVKIKYNSIGADRWKIPGQWIEWEVNVPETGLYKLSMRWKQDLKMNDTSSRSLYIDGEIPFLQSRNLQFAYNSSWMVSSLGESADKDGAYRFYLTSGKHIIRLEANLGSYDKVMQEVQETLLLLNKLYLSIVVVTGPQPDKFRDYNFDLLIPNSIIEMGVLSDKLKLIENEIMDITKVGGQSTAAIRKLYLDLDGMHSENETIGKKLNTFQNDISSLGSWLLASQQQPLQIDYLMLSAPGDKLPKAEKSAIALMSHYIQQFIGSFLVDYATVGDMNKSESSEKIKVWIGSGRDQAQIIKQIVNDYFTTKTKIGVNIQLVPVGSLLPATLAGLGPDIALGQAQAEPLNYALRNAVIDMSAFPDIDEIKNRFLPSALEPFSFAGKVYAIPETQSYPMLFYRTDILKELGVNLDDLNRWDTILESVLPKIQKNYLGFGVPSTINSFAIFLYQNGGQFYSKDNKKSELNSKSSISAFETFTELYTDYKQSIAFDFANRFRTGEMPIAINDFTSYNQLSVFAPEINGLWEMKPIPGIVQPDGTINRSVPGVVTGCFILSKSTKQNSAWEFVKWWTEEKTQILYSKELETIMGSAARYPTANINAMKSIQWGRNIKKSLNLQLEYVKAMPEIPGGYFTPRNFDFAFRSVVYEGNDIREVLNGSTSEIDAEIFSKRKEFKLEN